MPTELAGLHLQIIVKVRQDVRYLAAGMTHFLTASQVLPRAASWNVKIHQLANKGMILVLLPVASVQIVLAGKQPVIIPHIPGSQTYVGVVAVMVIRKYSRSKECEEKEDGLNSTHCSFCVYNRNVLEKPEATEHSESEHICVQSAANDEG
ncbi:hypothetical protein POSPLADRAFT_1044011 [Postia placenta MAD-698-R-SB12]|uniref:Uncharacterized protein n=1 Tax=Postia placenta MAD-698-R-SB12 TaxID=670580 RepID=A0A1X6NDY1_9APHY|nr:hypothetical protein POSPLADRAFT_1044011 [Postia placenta MAD-698-R-SB12]OSX66636.1 hypothetical protein POSPLADRAFT_1044011 [Postia placenta MAD-698-R-SB12]